MTTRDATAAAAAQAAQALHDAAREHKRLEAHHRRQAKALQTRLAQLRADLKRAGIDIDHPTQPGGGHSQ